MRVIEGGVDTFSALAYGMPDPMTMQWCNERVNYHRQSLMPEIRNYFDTNVNSVFSDIDVGAITRTAKAVIGRLQSAFVHDIPQVLTTLEEIQHAPPIMVRYIMAHPEIRSRYREDRLAGYDEQYVDEYAHETDEEYTLYREVINGVFIEQPDGDHIATEWLGEFEDSTLDFTDQVAIMETWENTIAHILAGESDPTSIYNNAL